MVNNIVMPGSPDVGELYVELNHLSKGSILATGNPTATKVLYFVTKYIACSIFLL